MFETLPYTQEDITVVYVGVHVVSVFSVFNIFNTVCWHSQIQCREIHTSKAVDTLHEVENFKLVFFLHAAEAPVHVFTFISFNFNQECSFVSAEDKLQVLRLG